MYRPPFLAAILLLTMPGDLDQVLSTELAKRPAVTATDLYKLLHQSVFGPGHLIQDVAAARGYLAQEMASLGPTQPGEVLREELGGGLLRVNLRPFRDAKGSTDELLRAMVATAKEIKGEPKTLDMRIKEACRHLEDNGSIKLATVLRALAQSQAQRGHPALHHSEPYRKAYQPAYRVVHERHFPK